MSVDNFMKKSSFKDLVKSKFILSIVVVPLALFMAYPIVEMAFGVVLGSNSSTQSYYRRHICRIDNVLAIHGNGTLSQYQYHIGGITERVKDGIITKSCSDVQPFVTSGYAKGRLQQTYTVKNYRIVKVVTADNAGYGGSYMQIPMQLRLWAAWMVNDRPLLWNKAELMPHPNPKLWGEIL